MRKVVGVLTGLALTMTVLMPSAAQAEGAPLSTSDVGDSSPIRLMFIGDSITQGSEGDYTWRYWLWRHLRQHKVDFDFVGDRSTLFPDANSYVFSRFDRDHEALWGRALWQVTDQVEEWVRTHTPDVLLVCLGVNDVYTQAWTDGGGPGRIRTFIDEARQANPRITIIWCELPPVANERYLADLPTANAELKGVVTDMTTQESRTLIAPIDPTYRTDIDAYDGVHPSPSGEIKLAASYATVLSSLGIGGGSLQATVPAHWPLRPKGMQVVKESKKSVRLSWSLVRGANCYQLHFSTTAKGSYVPVDSCLSRTTAVVSKRRSGLYAVTAHKGTWSSAKSAPVAVASSQRR